jgi:hypothetical protein
LFIHLFIRIQKIEQDFAFYLNRKEDE